MGPLFALALVGGGYLLFKSLSSSSSSSSGSATPAAGSEPKAGFGPTTVDAAGKTTSGGSGSASSSSLEGPRTWEYPSSSGGETGRKDGDTSAAGGEDDYVSEVIGKTSSGDTSDADADYTQGYSDGYEDYPSFTLWKTYQDGEARSFAWEQGYKDGRFARKKEEGIDVIEDSL